MTIPAVISPARDASEFAPCGKGDTRRRLECFVVCGAFFASPVSADTDLSELQNDILACKDMACVGEGAAVCMDLTQDGHTTFGMMYCLLKERDVWDAELNRAYAAARAEAKGMDAADQTHFPEYAVRDTQVRDAQRAWIAFRDANCAMEYGLWGSGSFRQIAGADCLMRMTAQRAFELRSYAEGLS